ncbi:MAG: Rieske (2Fe-2S) protein [Proteobacteria bacterium]|nr:Rieske (2Fe-2S) protein [Pseudomonadota bacterium]
MVEPSLHALACDLVGGDPIDERPERPTLGQALARAKPRQVTSARRGRSRFCVVTLEDGRSFALPDRCPHDGGLLSDGYVEGNRLVCARHGWEFDLVAGICPMRPAVRIDVTELRPGRRR